MGEDKFMVWRLRWMNKLAIFSNMTTNIIANQKGV